MTFNLRTLVPLRDDGGTSRTLSPSVGLARLGLRLGVAAAILQGVVHLVDVGTLDNRYTSLNADAEGNVFSWASSSATFAAGLMVLVLAFVRRDRVMLPALAAILWFFSLDDMIVLHENAAHVIRLHAGLPERDVRLIWPALYLPLLVVAVASLWRLAATVEPRLRDAILRGLGLLAFAVILEMGSTALVHSDAPGGATYAIEVVLEEGAELAGWAALAGAIGGAAFADAAGMLDALFRQQQIAVAKTSADETDAPAQLPEEVAQ
jgi:hypothetical protein